MHISQRSHVPLRKAQRLVVITTFQAILFALLVLKLINVEGILLDFYASLNLLL